MDELWDDDDGWLSDDDADNETKGGGGDDGDDAYGEKDLIYGDYGALQGANHVLVLVDSTSILTETNDTMNTTLRLLESIVRTKIRMVTIHKIGKRDGFGILLYNTKYRTPRQQQQDQSKIDNDENDNDNKKQKDDDEEDDDDDDDWNHYASNTTLPTTVHEFIPLVPPGIVTVKQIQGAQSDNITADPQYEIDLIPEYAKDTDDKNHLENNNDEDNDNDIPTTISLQVAVHQAIQMFRTAKCVKQITKSQAQQATSKSAPIDKKQLWIITNDDNPLVSVPSVFPMIQTTMSDAQENGIDIIVWPISSLFTSPGTSEFDYTLFYDKINAITPLRDTIPMETNDNSEDENEMKTMYHDVMISYMQQEFKKIRRTLCLPLLLPNWNYPSTVVDADNNYTSIKKEQDDAVTRSSTIQPDKLFSTSNSNVLSNVKNYWPSKCGIMLDIYKLIQPGRKPPKVSIHTETGHILSRVRQVVAAGGGGEVLAEYKTFGSPTARRTASAASERRLRRFVKFGSDRIPMTKSDQIAIRKAANGNEFASIIVLGFQPIDSVPFYHTLEHTYFVYPTSDSDDITDGKIPASAGGTEAFQYLRSSMIRKNVLAVGELLTRATATSRLVVLWPLGPRRSALDTVTGMEETVSSSDPNGDDDGDGFPPGLAMATIPFQDEVREIEPDIAVQTFAEQGTDVAPDDLVKAMSQLIQKQTLTDVEIGDNFDNAPLLQFWDYIEQIALEESTNGNQPRYYDTVLDPKEIRNLVGEQLATIQSLLPTDVAAPKKSSTAAEGRKRKIEPDDSGIDWYEVYNDNAVSSCKVPELKKKLRSVGEAISGNKAELVSRVQKLLEKEFGSAEPIFIKKE